jgi:hypothetical protein
VFARHFGPFDTGLPIAAQKLANLGTSTQGPGREIPVFNGIQRDTLHLV